MALSDRLAHMAGHKNLEANRTRHSLTYNVSNHQSEVIFEIQNVIAWQLRMVNDIVFKSLNGVVPYDKFETQTSIRSDIHFLVCQLNDKGVYLNRSDRYNANIQNNYNASSHRNTMALGSSAAHAINTQLSNDYSAILRSGVKNSGTVSLFRQTTRETPYRYITELPGFDVSPRRVRYQRRSGDVLVGRPFNLLESTSYIYSVSTSLTDALFGICPVYGPSGKKLPIHLLHNGGLVYGENYGLVRGIQDGVWSPVGYGTDGSGDALATLGNTWAAIFNLDGVAIDSYTKPFSNSGPSGYRKMTLFSPIYDDSGILRRLSTDKTKVGFSDPNEGNYNTDSLMVWYPPHTTITPNQDKVNIDSGRKLATIESVDYQNSMFLFDYLYYGPCPAIAEAYCFPPDTEFLYADIAHPRPRTVKQILTAARNQIGPFNGETITEASIAAASERAFVTYIKTLTKGPNDNTPATCTQLANFDGYGWTELKPWYHLVP